MITSPNIEDRLRGHPNESILCGSNDSDIGGSTNRSTATNDLP